MQAERDVRTDIEVGAGILVSAVLAVGRTNQIGHRMRVFEVSRAVTEPAI